jgi:signal-transduction protein with cAMP-binding, CBS, and nucleotidyltransferase domain
LFTVGLSSAKSEELMNKLQFATFEKGTKLYQEGKCTVRVMLIESGKVEVEVSDLLLDCTGLY